MSMDSQKAREWAKQNVLSAVEVAKLLNMTNVQVRQLTKCGKIKPLKRSGKDGAALYYLPDIVEYAQKRKKEALYREHIAEQRLMKYIGKTIDS